MEQAYELSQHEVAMSKMLNSILDLVQDHKEILEDILDRLDELETKGLELSVGYDND